MVLGCVERVELNPLPTILYPCRDPQGMGIRAYILIQVRLMFMVRVVVVVVI